MDPDSIPQSTAVPAKSPIVGSRFISDDHVLNLKAVNVRTVEEFELHDSTPYTGDQFVATFKEKEEGQLFLDLKAHQLRWSLTTDEMLKVLWSGDFETMMAATIKAKAKPMVPYEAST